MASENGSGSFRAGFLGLAVGAAAGFALGMLLAPEEGRKLRRRLAFQLDNASARIGDWIESLGDDTVKSEAKQKGESLVADVQQRARQIQDDMDALLEQLPETTPASTTGTRRRQADSLQ
jgi:gas vesicle protein